MHTTFSPADPSARLIIDAGCPSPGTVRLAVAGEIDLSNSHLLHVRLFNVLSTLRPRRIEVDLAGVTFLDCEGLTVLVVVGQVAARAGSCVQITNPQPLVHRLLELTGLLDTLIGGCDQPPPAATTANGTASAGMLVAL